MIPAVSLLQTLHSNCNHNSHSNQSLWRPCLYSLMEALVLLLLLLKELSFESQAQELQHEVQMSEVGFLSSLLFDQELQGKVEVFFCFVFV